MGQRLCIDIFDGDEIVANCYYHWSAYTGSTVELIKIILTDLERTKNFQVDKKIRVYEALRATGASLDLEEYNYIQSFNGDPRFNLLKKTVFQFDASTLNRSDGLISFSKDGIEKTQNVAEGFATIDLSNDTFSFDVFHAEDKEDLLDIYDMEEEDIQQLPRMHGRLNFDDLSMSDMTILDDLIEMAHNNEFSMVYLPDEHMYFQIIS